MTKKQETTEQKIIRWLVGVFSTGLSGAGGALGGVVFAPNEINLDDGLHKLLGMFGVCFVFSCLTYFQKSPLYDALYEPTNPKSDDK